MAVNTELVTKFRFKGSTKPLGDFNKSLSKSIGVMAKSVAGMAAVGFGLTAFAVNALKTSESLSILSQETGVSIEKIQELGFAASVSGSSAQALESTISSLSKKIGQAAMTGSADFSRLGISVRDASGEVKKADQILFEVANSFRRMNLSLPEQMNFASALGIDPSLVRLIKKSGGEIDALRLKARALGVVTSKQAKTINLFNDNLNILKFGLSALQKQIAIGMAPTITDLTKKFTDFLIANKDLISKGIEKTFKAIGYVFEAIKRLATFVSDIIESTIGWKVALAAVGAALVFLGSPIYAVVAAITAILLVVDDLIVAFKGGKSVIRDFFLEAFGFDITPVIQDLVGGFKNAVKIIKFIFKGLFDFIVSGIQGLLRVIDGIRSFFSDNDSDAQSPGSGVDMIQKKPFIPDYKISPSSTKSINQTVNIDVKAADPQATGRAISDTIQQEFKNANAQLNRGGR